MNDKFYELSPPAYTRTHGWYIATVENHDPFGLLASYLHSDLTIHGSTMSESQSTGYFKTEAEATNIRELYYAKWNIITPITSHQDAFDKAMKGI